MTNAMSSPTLLPPVSNSGTSHLIERRMGTTL